MSASSIIKGDRSIVEGGGEEGLQYAQKQLDKIAKQEGQDAFPIGYQCGPHRICIVTALLDSETDAYLYWLITSFITYSIYFIIMFIPISSEKGPKKTKEEKAAGSMGAMMKKNKKLFGQMFWNVFLCDSEQLLPGAVDPVPHQHLLRLLHLSSPTQVTSRPTSCTWSSFSPS